MRHASLIGTQYPRARPTSSTALLERSKCCASKKRRRARVNTRATSLTRTSAAGVDRMNLTTDMATIDNITVTAEVMIIDLQATAEETGSAAVAVIAIRHMATEVVTVEAIAAIVAEEAVVADAVEVEVEVAAVVEMDPRNTGVWTIQTMDSRAMMDRMRSTSTRHRRLPFLVVDMLTREFLDSLPRTEVRHTVKYVQHRHFKMCSKACMFS